MRYFRIMRYLTLALLALVAAPASASNEVPLSPLGLPMAPKPLTPEHPLYHRIALDPVADMPNVVGASATAGFIGAAKRSSFDKAVRETLEKLNMLAPTDADARFRLSPRWLGMDAPFRISFSSRATARLDWKLNRIDTGQQIFRREIATPSEAKGRDGSLRAVGVGRMALMTNIASAAVCIDAAAYGHAAADCALTPGFRYEAPRASARFVYYRRR